MTKYLNRSGKSSVLGYSFTENSISILFKDQKFIYTYNELKPGVVKVHRMIRYAQAGKGLNSYIKTGVKGNYYLKIPTR
jgi:hypothetical protein